MASISDTETKAALEKALERMKLNNGWVDEFLKPQKPPSIYKVHKHLRDVNKEAYEPEIVAIGPYHHGKDHLEMMEEHKRRYLNSLLLRAPRVNIEEYFLVVENREREARRCYAESLSQLDRAKFIEMLVVDGCFIVELILKWSEYSTHDNDPIFQTLWSLSSLKRDLMLFENQIPFFILGDFVNLIVPAILPNFWFIDLVLNFFRGIHPGKRGSNKRKSVSHDVKHILHLLHINWCHSADDDDDDRTTKFESNTAEAVERNHGTKNSCSQDVKKRILDLLHCNWSHSSDVTIKLESDTAGGDDRKNFGSQKRILNLLKHCSWSHSSDAGKIESKNVNSESPVSTPSASELRDSNVKFQMGESNNLFDVKFVKGTLSMAPLTIQDHTECVFRNLIAYEQYFPNDGPPSFTNHMGLLDCLINSSTDVEILCRCKILENWLGDNEVVAKIFNRLGDSITLNPPFPYASTLDDINTHCQKRRHRAIAKLKRDYFNSPWAYVSFIAALVLLLLTVAQTALSAIQLA